MLPDAAPLFQGLKTFFFMIARIDQGMLHFPGNSDPLKRRLFGVAQALFAKSTQALMSSFLTILSSFLAPTSVFFDLFISDFPIIPILSY
ncbi:hypothetical protein ABA45_05685 [Marinobacter psychrophilus]|uniref:Uncharacterized protein n=1 Tax=Marinobacter psychrophilus TaxID=330734 RepID=A0A0H4HZ44_9GAMM|nr:hypothetical protein ABA45_05685 [Marinobacter psychrophilus]